MLPELSQDMTRMVALYGRRIRAGEVPLADAVAKFSDYDRRNGQPARSSEWQARLSAATKAPAQAIEQPVLRMTRGMRIGSQFDLHCVKKG